MDAAKPAEVASASLLRTAGRACQLGVPRCHIISYREDCALLQELFTHDGSGTLVANDEYERLRPANIDDVGGILELIEPLEQDGVLVKRSRELLETEIGRFRVLSLDPEVRLYLSPIQFDPMDLPPVLDITAPAGFVDELADRFGRFKTIGWAIDTWSITDGTIDEAVFLEDVEKTEAKYREMLGGLLADDDWDVLVHYFEFTDRVQHVMFRHFDPEHPLYTEEGAARWGGAILDSYKTMDTIVGEVEAAMPDGAVLLVVSDHGFAPWRRTMNYNNWLAQEGYLVLEGEGPARANLEDLFDQGEFFVNVDWSRTRAYAMGLGNIYINLAGREGQGIVQPGEEYRALQAEIKAKLEAFVDPETGEHPVAHVFTRDEAYGTYDPALIPDMLIVQTDKDPATAAWLNWVGVPPLANGWGGRKLQDDVVDLALLAVFGDPFGADPSGAAGKDGLSGTYAPPAFRMASTVTTASIDRSRQKATGTSGPAPSVSSRRASRFARRSSSA